MQLSAKPSVGVVDAEAAAQAQNTRCRHRVLKARLLRSSRRELVAGFEATSSNGLILFRAFVQALGGLDPCRNERKMGQNMVQINSFRQTDTQKPTTSNFFFATQKETFVSRGFHDPLDSSSLVCGTKIGCSLFFAAGSSLQSEVNRSTWWRGTPTFLCSAAKGPEPEHFPRTSFPLPCARQNTR